MHALSPKHALSIFLCDNSLIVRKDAAYEFITACRRYGAAGRARWDDFRKVEQKPVTRVDKAQMIAGQ